MTSTDVLEAIHELYEKNTDYPVTGEEDFDARLSLVRASVRKWQNEINNGTLWKELFEPLSSTMTTSDQADAPADWLAPGGSLWIGSTEYKYVRPERARQTVKTDPTARIYWLTGNRPAVKINVNPAPGAGVAFETDYYREAFSPVTGDEATELEMSSPYFVVYDVLTQLYIDDENTIQADFNLNLANEQMSGMKMANESTPLFQPNGFDSLEEDGFGT